VRENFTEIFKSYFGHVITTDNGRDALELYAQQKVDVAILDISIPHISGLNLASHIREANKEIEIIMLSAYSDREKLLHALNLQLYTYLVKPVQHDELDKTLTGLIDKLTHNKAEKLLGGFAWQSDVELLSYNGNYIKLTKNEIKVISLLIKSPNNYLKPCEINDSLFNKIGDKDCNNIVQLISRLKKKFNTLKYSEDFFIQSNYGLGYKIIFT